MIRRVETNTKERKTMDLFINGYIFTLVKGRKDQTGKIQEPCFLGKYGWALESVIKSKRTKWK